jgi:hypothetical protein
MGQVPWAMRRVSLHGAADVGQPEPAGQEMSPGKPPGGQGSVKFMARTC